MSEEYASLLVEVSIAVNEGLFEVTRTPESTTRTRIEDFLRTALAPSSAGSKATRTLG